MTQILRVKTKWTGFNGGPGYTVLHFGPSSGSPDGGTFASAGTAKQAADRTQAFFNAIRGWVPSVVRFNVEPDVDVLDDATGDLVSSFGVTAPAEVSGAATGTYSGATGAIVNWRTAGIRNGRKVRGRTFLVPVGNPSLSATGQLDSTARGVIATAATALMTPGAGPALGVYARPTGPGIADGVWHPVLSSNVPAMLAVLRSRRD